MNISNSALGHERPGAHIQAGGYADTPTSYAVAGHIPGPRSAAVSWAAVVAGAAAAASLSLILLILGVGLGLSSVSPWAGEGIAAATFGVSTIVWLTVTQVLASAAGGYLAGRLRSKWSEIHSDEVYFRDTAHGFLAWAVACRPARQWPVARPPRRQWPPARVRTLAMSPAARRKPSATSATCFSAGTEAPRPQPTAARPLRLHRPMVPQWP